jgi:hypothetical protein
MISIHYTFSRYGIAGEQRKRSMAFSKSSFKSLPEEHREDAVSHRRARDISEAILGTDGVRERR